jgi:hypothetical protein
MLLYVMDGALCVRTLFVPRSRLDGMLALVARRGLTLVDALTLERLPTTLVSLDLSF